MNEFYVANPDVLFREEGEDGAILFYPVTGEVKILNETGALIFKLCNGKNTKQDIMNKIIKTFDIKNRKMIEKDINIFLQELREKELIGFRLIGEGKNAKKDI